MPHALLIWLTLEACYAAWEVSNAAFAIACDEPIRQWGLRGGVAQHVDERIHERCMQAQLLKMRPLDDPDVLVVLHNRAGCESFMWCAIEQLLHQQQISLPGESSHQKVSQCLVRLHCLKRDAVQGGMMLVEEKVKSRLISKMRFCKCIQAV